LLPTQEGGTTYELSIKDDLEDPEIIPNPDDLIINSDGKFLRVTSVEGTLITATLIAVSGTGGGSGGGGEDVNLGKAIFTYLTPMTINFRYGDNISLKFNF
jgi:hypothetical protein